MAFDAGAIVGKVQLDSKELATSVEKVNQEVGSIGTTANQTSDKVDKSNQGMIRGFRSQIQPINYLRRTIFMVGSIWTATAGIAITAVVNLEKSYEQLYKTSGTLGLSVSDLSNKLYGFNIASIQARTGSGILNNAIQAAKDLWIKLGAAIATATNEYAVYQKRIQMDVQNKSGLQNFIDGLISVLPGLREVTGQIKTTQAEAQKALTAEVQAQRDNSLEAYNIRADLTSKILALQGNEYESTKTSLDAQKQYYIDTYGANSEIVKTYDTFIQETLSKMAPRNDLFAGFRAGINQSIQDLSNWGQTGISMANQLSSGMKSSFSNLFQGLFKGDISSFDDFLTSIGDLFLQTISDMIAQLVVLWIWQKLTGLFFSGATSGVSNIASSSFNTSGLSLGGFAEGTESVPYTGDYKLHEGEKVTPKYDANKSEDLQLTIVNQITPEAVATAMSGKEGAGVIVNTMDTNALRNGSTRRTIRRK